MEVHTLCQRLHSPNIYKYTKKKFQVEKYLNLLTTHVRIQVNTKAMFLVLLWCSLKNLLWIVVRIYQYDEVIEETGL